MNMEKAPTIASLQLTREKQKEDVQNFFSQSHICILGLTESLKKRQHGEQR